MGEPPSLEVIRLDPYKNYRFVVYFDDTSIPVAGINQASGLPPFSGSIEQNQSGSPANLRKSPGRSKYESVTLERGITYDGAFAQWAGQVWASEVTHPGVPLAPSSVVHRNIRIVQLNEAFQPVSQYLGRNCWVSEYRALPDLKAEPGAVAIQFIKLESEGWIIDTVIAELQQP
jgi:phage tail-like protein